jgi:hypothetical protein
VSAFIQAIAINATVFGLFVCVGRYERNIRLSLVLKLALVTIDGAVNLLMPLGGIVVWMPPMKR